MTMNTQKDSTGGCCPPPPCSADPFLEEVSDKIRRGEPVGIMEALAAIEYQSARRVLPWWRKDALGWPIETFKCKPVQSAIRIICQNIRKVIFKPNAEVSHGCAEKNL
jgi:hypothetical protein